ncbi:MAG: hypothetical protein IKG96_05475, partial [Bacteroidaceae bacterium]|nr:hypothetical protein [Bacteroidaceae bacterium]
DLVYAYWGLTEALQDRNHENCCMTKDLSECLNAKKKKEDVPILTHPLAVLLSLEFGLHRAFLRQQEVRNGRQKASLR